MNANEKLVNSRKLLFLQLRDAHLFARKGFRAAEDKGLDERGTFNPDELRDIKSLLATADSIKETLSRIDVLEAVVR